MSRNDSTPARRDTTERKPRVGFLLKSGIRAGGKDPCESPIDLPQGR